MRLYNISYICKKYLPDIQEVKIIFEASGYRVKGWGKCKKSMEIIRNIDYFRTIVDKIYFSLDAFNRDLEEPLISQIRANSIEQNFKELLGAMKVLAELYDFSKMEKSGGGIDVKIPNCDSLKEYISYLKDIDFIFTQCPYFLNDKEEIKFKKVDIGSQWLIFCIVGISGSFYILNNLAKLIQKVVEIKSNVLVYKQQEEVLKEMQKKNEVSKEILEVFNKMKQIVIDKCVTDLESDIGELSDGEERDKVKKTLEIMMKLMDKGVEFHSSIETPKEIQVLFPPEKDIEALSDNVLKLIEERGNEEE